MKFSKLIAAAALSSALVFSGVSSAQDTNTNTNATRRTERRGPTLQQRLDRLSTELKLNDDQKAKVKELFEKQAKERREIVSDRNLARDERREKVRALTEEQNKQFKAILTAEQFEKWQTLREQMRANRPGGRDRSGEPAPAPAPPPTSKNSQAQ